jgi:hypothetical protein
VIEDTAAVELIDETAGVEGVNLLAVGPSDLSRSLGVSGQPDHPRHVAAIDRVREAVKKGAGARLALLLNHAALSAPCGGLPRTRRRLHQLRADPGSPPAAIIADAGVRSPQAPRVALAARVPPGLRGAGLAAALAVSLFFPEIYSGPARFCRRNPRFSPS